MTAGKGGLELYAVRAAEELRARGHICHVLAAPGSFVESQCRRRGIPVLLLRIANRVLPLLAAVRLARLLRTNNYDVVHVHATKDLNVCALARRLGVRGTKFVHTRHMELTRAKHDPYHRFIYSSLDRILVITEQLRGSARRFLPNPNIELLYPGVPRREPPSVAVCATVRGDLASCFVVGLIGRIEFAKGQHVLVEAVRLLRARGIPAAAVMIGHVMDTRYHAQLEATVRDNALHDWVRYLGAHDDPPSIVGCFDVVVLLTECETFGLVLPEAMRAGVPVVGTDAGGVKEIIQHEKSGLRIPAGDGEALAEALARLWSDAELRRRLAEAGRQRADRMFSDEHHYAELEKVYSGVQAGSGEPVSGAEL